jgi:hypothetical protein
VAVELCPLVAEYSANCVDSAKLAEVDEAAWLDSSERELDGVNPAKLLVNE